MRLRCCCCCCWVVGRILSPPEESSQRRSHQPMQQQVGCLRRTGSALLFADVCCWAQLTNRFGSLVSTAQLLLSRLPTELIRTSAPQHSRVTFRASSQVLSPFLIALSHRPFPFSPLHLFRFERRALSTRSQRFCSTAPPVQQLSPAPASPFQELPTRLWSLHTGPPTLLRVRSCVV